MRSVALLIPKQHYPRFGEHLKAWERSTGNDARWVIGDMVDPMRTTNLSSPVTVSCQLDDTFFQQYPEWGKYVTR